jgi:multidrug efflux pump subunit AcrA (membrane-fusion protein)
LTGIALLAGSLALLSAGCGQKAGGADKSTALQATPVDVMPVTLGSISRTISVVGSLATLYNVNLSSNTTGRLTNVFVREGDFVHKSSTRSRSRTKTSPSRRRSPS